MQEVISNIVVTENNEKLCQNLGILGTQGSFSDKVSPDIVPKVSPDFTVEPVFQYHVQVVENAFIDDCK